MTMDQGAYPAFPFSAAMYPMMIRVMMPGPYRPGCARVQHHAHRVEQGHLRRVPRPVGGRDVGARAHARPRGARPRDRSRRDPPAQHDRRPTSCRAKMLTGPTLDVRMSARATLERALEIADLGGWEDRQAAARAEGRCIGVGFATFIEAAPGPPDFQESIMAGGGGGLLAGEPARSVLEADGTVSVVHPADAARAGPRDDAGPGRRRPARRPDRAGEAPLRRHPITPFGLSGTGGSRSAPMAGGAVTYSAARAARPDRSTSPPTCSRRRATTS